MKAHNRRRFILAGLVGASLWWYNYTPQPTVLSFRVGQPFEEVVRNSTYPVMDRSNLPADDTIGFGATWVTEPAVIVRFNDPKHGFTLPPTKFAALSYQHNVASTLATSPMLEKLPFAQAVMVLESLQNQFKTGGWEPYDVHKSEWFDLTTKGRKQLNLAMFEPPYYQQQTLRVPKKYAMTFRFLCAEGCWTREPPYLFLIQVGLSHDTYGWEGDGPQIWEKSHPANHAAAKPAQHD